MKTKLVIFDLDGVLFDSKDIHYEALNRALEKVENTSEGGEGYSISKEEHTAVYDGLPTRRKLELLTQKRGLPPEKYAQIWRDKQESTTQILSEKAADDHELIGYFAQLRKSGCKIAVASNSIRNTVKLILLRLGLLEFVDIYISNEDVFRNKPHPEMYWRCMTAVGAIPDCTVIIEDSHIGRQGALDSKCHLVPVENRGDLNQQKIDRVQHLLGGDEKKRRVSWESQTLNVLIPMAGHGSRFESHGYTFPKPLIEVHGKPMIQVVVDNLNINANFIFIVQKTHYEKYHLNFLLPLIAPNCRIVQVDSVTEGAACTTLLAERFINNNNPLLIANSDQYLNWNSNETLYAFNNGNADGYIVTFPSIHSKWSYAKLGEDGYVCEVAEKKPISKHATAGLYYWVKGADYCTYARQMIAKDIRVNSEFYVCPVFNEAIADGKKIRIKDIGENSMWGLGTPEDLNYFLEHHKTPDTL